MSVVAMYSYLYQSSTSQALQKALAELAVKSTTNGLVVFTVAIRTYEFVIGSKHSFTNYYYKG